MKRRFALSVAVAALVSPALGQELPANILSATLREGWRTEAGTQMAALELKLAPGWKTYWRAPGEAGIPPEFDWAGSSNIRSVAFHWPRPEVFDLNGMRTFGYHEALVLPVEFSPADAGRPIAVRARIDLGVCNQICVPVTVSVAGELLPGAAPDPVIGAALADLPEPAAAAGLSAAHCAAEPIRDGVRLTSRLDMPPIGPEEVAVVELSDRTVWVSPAETRRDGGELSATADLVPSDAKPFALDRSSVRITVFGAAGRVVEVKGCTG
ncbi:protein-disulfide reductase DsbD domain-containing protein [Albidovulum sp.]|uniref:protein-disulfide reductase DsbD domain-containing protein n=1 Tax=Albidovulum sp. TaxID=1872424 RepID=UPI0039B898EE